MQYSIDCTVVFVSGFVQYLKKFRYILEILEDPEARNFYLLIFSYLRKSYGSSVARRKFKIGGL